MNRETLIEMIAQEWTDNADLSSLMEFFYNEQVKYLDDLTDSELLEKADESGLIVDKLND